jgi:peptidoglycan/LPS O-acetylase OafA/YrhL
MSTVSNPVTSERIKELDGWRAVSVLLVIGSHFASFRQIHLSLFSYTASRAVNWAGNLGVSVFFFISGFVICRLFLFEEKRFRSVSVRGFYIRRVFRILPPLYAYLATVALLFAAGLIRCDWDAFRFAAAFLSDLEHSPFNWFVGHIWSLAVEEQFYLVFPAMWVLTPRRWRSRAVAATFLLCIALSLAFPFPPFNLGVGLYARFGFAAISLGVWAAINERRVRQAAARVPGVLVALVALILIYRPMHEGIQYELILFSAVFMPPAIGLILMYSLERGKWLRAALCSRPIQAIGVTSYGIYLWQQIFTAGPIKFTPGGAAIAHLLPLLFIVVPLSYFLLEKPAMQFGKTLSRKLRRGASVHPGAVA